MNFHGRNHPCMKELLFQDALVAGKASLQDKKQISRCSSGQNGQSGQNNQRHQKIQHSQSQHKLQKREEIMSTFKYKALTKEGMQISGVVQASDQYRAADQIRTTAPVILSLTPVREKGDSFWTRDIGGNRVNLKNLSILCNQIAITLRAGVPIARCLDMIGGQTEDKLLRKIFLKTAEDVAGGAGLANSIRRNGPQLPATLIETIRAGEESGNIERSFEEMAQYYEKQYKTQSKIKSALSYPIFVVCVAVVVLIVVMVVVIPTLTQTFAELGGELPIMTQVLISTSEFFSKYWIFMVIAILALVLAWKMYVKTDNGIMTQGRMQLNMPVLGKIHRMSGAAEFANTMSMLLSSGLNVDRAIDITAKTLNNSVLRKETESMIARIEEGHPLGECIRDCKNYPRTLQEMCAMGEETGELDSSLKVIGYFYTNEADTATKDALAKLEPTMLVLLAVFAGFIVISIYLPMFTMYNLM